MTTEQVLGLIFTNLLDNKWFGEVDSEMNIDAMFNYLVGFRIRGVWVSENRIIVGMERKMMIRRKESMNTFLFDIENFVN